MSNISKTLISVLVVAVLVVGGYFAFSKIGKNNSEQNIANVVGSMGSEFDSTNIDPNTDTEKKMTFSKFVQNGGSYKCTITQNVAGTSTEGTAYMNNGMLRGEFRTQLKGVNVDSNLIVRDGYAYTWSSAAPSMGVKIKAEVDNSNPQLSAENSFWTGDQVGDYQCDPWTPEEAKFTLPKNVTFKDMTSVETKAESSSMNQ